MLKQHCESSPWFTRWVQHGARWPPTFEPSRSAWAISPPVGCQLTTLTIAILLLLSPKADTHFAIPRRVEGWVYLVGWLHTETVYLLAHSHHPSTNRARRRVTTLIETIALPLSHATQSASNDISRRWTDPKRQPCTRPSSSAVKQHVDSDWLD